ncbi:hypothetical protein [Comamonas testosteroni]|uniref:hypothetical protein n=1 Tax=Comamonas testosteroni TaxID=285 RepID=UPI0005B4DB31|nr:hypothetical protein [Comamonas testosteroni]
MADLLEVPQEHLLLEQVQSVVLLEPKGGNDLLEVPIEQLEVLEVVQDNTLHETVPELVILTEAQQGPPGPPGAPGQAGVSYVTFKASGPIGGHRAVCAAFSGLVKYADSRDVTGAMSVLGLSLHAAEDGAPINVANSGEVIEPSWSWTQDLPIFVGLDGVLTQQPPDTGYQLVVAIATSSTSALLSIKQPIVI